MPDFRARYEFKYLIREEQADWIREVVQAHCDHDAYGDNGTYDVNSLYFDNWEWELAMGTVEGIRNRYKIRIRTYAFDDDAPVFCENKGRVGTSICKSRAMMERRFVDAVCKNDPSPFPDEGFPAMKASHQADLDRFRNLVDLVDLRPRLWVRYSREAYGSRFEDNARLTFDRFLEVQAPDPEQPYVPRDGLWQRIALDGPQTILEMKFNGAFPYWMKFIVHSLQLRRTSCSKYVQGVEQLGNVPWNHVEWRPQWTVY